VLLRDRLLQGGEVCRLRQDVPCPVVERAHRLAVQGVVGPSGIVRDEDLARGEGAEDRPGRDVVREAGQLGLPALGLPDLERAQHQAAALDAGDPPPGRHHRPGRLGPFDEVDREHEDLVDVVGAGAGEVRPDPGGARIGLPDRIAGEERADVRRDLRRGSGLRRAGSEDGDEGTADRRDAQHCPRGHSDRRSL
jgi:hypothetical protein